MELKEDTVIVLRVWQDHMMETSFLDVLGTRQIYSVKLPSTIDKYKFGHLINPEYLLDIELIKTRKNWILKNVSIKERLARLTTYEEHVKLSEMIKLVQKFTSTEQDTYLQSAIIPFLRDVAMTDMTEFEAAVLSEAGFLQNNTYTPLVTRVKTTKDTNNLNG